MGSGVKPQPPTILMNFEDLETLLMTSKMYIVLCTWFVVPCPSLNQQSSHNFCIFCIAKIPRPLSAPLLLAPEGICPSVPLLTADTGSTTQLCTTRSIKSRRQFRSIYTVCQKITPFIWLQCLEMSTDFYNIWQRVYGGTKYWLMLLHYLGKLSYYLWAFRTFTPVACVCDSEENQLFVLL